MLRDTQAESEPPAYRYQRVAKWVHPNAAEGRNRASGRYKKANFRAVEWTMPPVRVAVGALPDTIIGQRPSPSS